jgi:hypothetical protein
MVNFEIIKDDWHPSPWLTAAFEASIPFHPQIDP